MNKFLNMANNIASKFLYHDRFFKNNLFVIKNKEGQYARGEQYTSDFLDAQLFTYHEATNEIFGRDNETMVEWLNEKRRLAKESK